MLAGTPPDDVEIHRDKPYSGISQKEIEVAGIAQAEVDEVKKVMDAINKNHSLNFKASTVYPAKERGYTQFNIVFERMPDGGLAYKHA